MSGTLKVTTLQDGASATANMTFDTSGNTTAGGTLAMASSFKRNRIINGNMTIDQRNAGASGTASTYTVDRWYYGANQSNKFTWQQNLNSLTPPTGYTKYMGFTASSSYTVLTGDYFHLIQAIEGVNVADLAFGTASALTVTVSFWVRSSLTGAFGAVLRNGNATYAYPFQYTINSANTWEYKTITIPGATSGTWVTTTSSGMALAFGLGVGTTYSAPVNTWIAQDVATAQGVNVVSTSGATWYVTGVQLEVGTKATPYEMQIYSDQLAQCQRYFISYTAPVSNAIFGVGQCYAATLAFATISYPVEMRSAPTATFSSAGDFVVLGSGGGAISATSLGYDRATSKTIMVTVTVASGLSNGNATALAANNTSAKISISSEL